MNSINGIQRIQSTYDKQRNLGKVDKTEMVSKKKDDVTISSQAKDFQTVMKAIRDVPDVRGDVVSQVSSKYEAGNYNVGGGDIIDKLTKK